MRSIFHLCNCIMTEFTSDNRDNQLTVVAMQPVLTTDLSERLPYAEDMIEKAHAECGAGLYVFPEYYLNHFDEDPNNTKATAQQIPGPATRELMRIARNKQSVIIMGMLETSTDPQRPYNTAVMVSGDSVVGVYRKTHLWDLGPTSEAFRECVLFTPGDRIECFTYDKWSIGVMICADGLFPEVPRILALSGATMLAYPNSRECVGHEAETAAAVNSLPIVVSNPVGFNGVDACEGSSRIIGVDATVLSRAPDGSDGWAHARLNCGHSLHARSVNNCIRLRRPDLYGQLIQAAS